MRQYTKRKQKREKMFKHIEHYYSDSGDLTKKAFCQRENIPYSSFLFWLQKYEQEKKENRTEENPGSFIPVQIKASETGHHNSSASLTVEYPNGVKVHINGDPDIGIITGLIHAQAG
jgi:CO/xanthine dehydrogenase Mo-binding subunit